MNTKQLMLEQVDKQTSAWQQLGKKSPRPKIGWIKTVRQSLGMTRAQLATRLGVSPLRISQLERAEIEDATTLHSLRKAAEAMNCELIYSIVPKQTSSHHSLQGMIETRAAQVAQQQIARVAHSMSLEAQSVILNKNQQKQQIKNLAKELIRNSRKKIWEDK